MEPASDTKTTTQTISSSLNLGNHIAWAGECELLQASWSLDSGRMVEFRIVERPGPDRIHPFKEYTRRRGNHAGQLFELSVSDVDTQRIVYADGGMLAGWGESHDKGQWLKFWLDEEADRHPFAGCRRRSSAETGQMFMLAAVLLDTDGRPIDPGQERRMEIHETHPKQRSPSQSIYLMVTGHRFVQYLKEKSDWTKRLARAGREWTPDLAKSYVKFRLKIESLSDLDRNPEKLKEFHQIIRRPFEKWAGYE